MKDSTIVEFEQDARHSIEKGFTTMWTNAYSTEDIGAHIAGLRKGAGMNQAEFAEKIGLSRTTLSKMENGAPVSSEKLVKALSYLGTRFVLVPKRAQVRVNDSAPAKPLSSSDPTQARPS